MHKSVHSLGLLGLLIILVPIVTWLHGRFLNSLAVGLVRNSCHPIPSPRAVRIFALGYDRLVADCYWLAFINYIGDIDSRAVDRSQLAEKYLDLVTELDPKFLQPYWFCAFIIGAQQRQPLRANELILRGISSNPNEWNLPYIAGINMYLYAHDEVAASKYYRLAATLPAAPFWLDRQAQILSENIPSIIKEINVWQTIYSSQNSGAIRAEARNRLVQLWSLIYHKSKSDVIRSKAKKSLKELGVEI